jgi:DnaK suppressor protein
MNTSRSASTHDRVVAGNRRRLEAAFHTFEAAVAGGGDPALIRYSDNVERAQAMQARDVGEALRRMLMEHQLVVGRAIEQMAAGAYGFCEDCSRPIDAERLRVLPEATRCVDCQRQQDRSS